MDFRLAVSSFKIFVLALVFAKCLSPSYFKIENDIIYLLQRFNKSIISCAGLRAIAFMCISQRSFCGFSSSSQGANLDQI